MTTRIEEQPAYSPSSLRLWFGFLAGPLGWTAHLLLSYPLVPLVCASGLEIILYLVSLVTMAVIVVGGFVTWRIWQRARKDVPRDDDDRAVIRTRFMALTGLLMNGLFLFVTAVESLPILLQDPCV